MINFTREKLTCSRKYLRSRVPDREREIDQESPANGRVPNREGGAGDRVVMIPSKLNDKDSMKGFILNDKVTEPVPLLFTSIQVLSLNDISHF